MMMLSVYSSQVSTVKVKSVAMIFDPQGQCKPGG